VKCYVCANAKGLCAHGRNGIKRPKGTPVRLTRAKAAEVILPGGKWNPVPPKAHQVTFLTEQDRTINPELLRAYLEAQEARRAEGEGAAA
jgi:hypothetical protein